MCRWKTARRNPQRSRRPGRARRQSPANAVCQLAFAPFAGGGACRAWLSKRTVTAVAIEWKEDVRIWHPGQEWLWQPGGLGVFDPGINALSIVTHILPTPFFLTEARLSYPENRGNPIAAALTFTDDRQTPITAELDWRQTGSPIWTIDIKTDDGTLRLLQGASRMIIDDEIILEEEQAEYPGVYARFACLIDAKRGDADASPLRHAADSFMLGRRETVAPFIDDGEGPVP